MNKRISNFLFAAAASFAVAACGGGDGGTGPSFSDSVTTAEATDFADGAASTATYLADNLNFGSPSFGATKAMYARIQAQPRIAAARSRLTHLPALQPTALNWESVKAMMSPAGLQAVSAEGCTYSGHGLWDIPFGDPVDVNGNGVPDDAAVDIVCVQTTPGTGDTVYTQTEEEHIAVKEIAGSVYGMVASFRIRERWNDNHGSFEQGEIKQTATIDLRSSTASTDQAMNVEYSANDASVPDGAASEGGGEEWGADFAADDPIVYGDPLPDGDLNLHGRSFYYSEPDGRNLSFTISTPTLLAYNAACAAVPTNPPFTAGVLLGKLNNSSSQASFEVTFTGCGTYTVAVDNANDPAAVAAR